MIVVTGTKRSGTSMWMQVLRRGGATSIGEAFPMRWGEGLREANPDGFYESTLREGIYHATNPDPVTGHYLHPADTRDAAVKVFLPGLVRTDHAFLHHVVFTVRDWRAYVRSVRKLEALDHPGQPPRVDVAAALEWWAENFMGLRDLLVRRYPCQMLAYETALEQPEVVVPQLLAWVGLTDAPADAAQGVRAPPSPDDSPIDLEGLPPQAAQVFDHFYGCIRHGEPLTEALFTDMNGLHQHLAPLVVDYARAAAQRREAVAQ